MTDGENGFKGRPYAAVLYSGIHPRTNQPLRRLLVKIANRLGFLSCDAYISNSKTDKKTRLKKEPILRSK